MQITNDDQKIFIDFINSYNKCFYHKDIEQLKKYYDSENNVLSYFDYHKHNDTFNLDQHINLLSDFFKNWKPTESGDVEP